MPRFHLNLSDGAGDPDAEGYEFEDLAAARVAAVKFLAQSLLDRPAEFLTDGQWTLGVDSAMERLMTLRIEADDRLAPILSPAHQGPQVG